MKMGKMYEAKVLVEAGGGSGTFDVNYFKMTDKAHPLATPVESSASEPKSSGSVGRSSNSFGRSSNSVAKSSATVGPTSSTEALPMDLQSMTVSGNFQVFDMQGKYLGQIEVAQGMTVTSAIKARFQNAGVYLVKGNGRLHRIAVK